jgi:hypothetical protein
LSSKEYTSVLSVRVDGLERRIGMMETKLDGVTTYVLTTLVLVVGVLIGIIWQHVVIKNGRNKST